MGVFQNGKIDFQKLGISCNQVNVWVAGGLNDFLRRHGRKVINFLRISAGHQEIAESSLAFVAVEPVGGISLLVHVDKQDSHPPAFSQGIGRVDGNGCFSYPTLPVEKADGTHVDSSVLCG